jgi:hypothetical protein
MKALPAFCVVALLAFAPGARAAPAPAAIRDLHGIMESMDSMCSPEVHGRPRWQDEKLLSQACELPFGESPQDRMLFATNKMGYCLVGRSWRRCRPGSALDYREAPREIRGAGVANELIYMARHFNKYCRGAVTEDSKLLESICNIRDRLFNALSKRGFCYGKQGQIGADMRWHKCTRNSLR